MAINAVPWRVVACFWCLAAWSQESRPRAVIIGVGQYPRYEPTKPLRFPAHDADLMEQLFREGAFGKVAARDIAGLRNEQATSWRVHFALRRALLTARATDTVYISLSARGVAWPGSKDGYVGTSDFVEEKPESTAIAVSQLAEYIRFSRARLIVLLADVCRAPVSMSPDNRINMRLEELGQFRNVIGLLASEKQNASIEIETLRFGNTEGFGLFSHTVGSVLKAAKGSIGAIWWRKSDKKY